MKRRLLLLSNSVQHGKGILEHAEQELKAFLGSLRRVAFAPYAAHDLDAYEKKAHDKFHALGYDLFSVHHEPCGVLGKAYAIFVGGGNTFRLLYRLYERQVFGRIKEAVVDGIPYIGSRAGSIVAGPTTKTTKDMPVLEPESFDSFGFVPFQISPHYLDPDPASTHMGETQAERICHFLEENDAQIAGLREGSMLAVSGDSVGFRG